MWTVPFSLYTKKGGFIFTSGQVHLYDGKLVEGSIEDKTHQVMRNLEEVLNGAGASLKDVIKTTVYVTDMTNYEKVNHIYQSYFPEENFPAREFIAVKELPLGAEVEMSMIAFKP